MSTEHLPLEDELRARIREAGLRVTGSRFATLRCLHEAARPMSHAEVVEQLAPDGWDRASIYRVLVDLADAGLLRRMDLGDHIWRFELIDACRPIADDHAHFLCESCGDITCLPELALSFGGGKALPPELRGAELRVKLTGRCGACVE